MLAFIIPVKHPARSRSYEKVTNLLRDTLKSVEAQQDRRFCTVVVGNQKPDWWQDTPTRRFIEVGFPPAEPPKTQKDWVNWLYLDRGAKLAIAIVHARDAMGATHVMPVDADDFVSDRLAGFIHENADVPGWYMPTGLIWSGLFRIGEERSKFWSYCGTSHLFRTELFPVPSHLGAHSTREQVVEALGAEYVEKILGNHVHFMKHFGAKGIELQPLPFIGGVWHADTGENSSRAWWSGTRFGPIWGHPLSAEQVREFSIPPRDRRVTESLLLFGWRTRSRMARLAKKLSPAKS